VTGFSEDFTRDGFCLFRGFLTQIEVEALAADVLPAHERWLQKYADGLLVNSNYLTAPAFCPDAKARLNLFRFISQKKLVQIAAALCPRGVYFLNTQLFFNPRDAAKKPYWHRDVQYLGIDETEQQQLILRDTVLHFRIALADDPGLDFVPGSHARWDTPTEREIRLELNGHTHAESIPGQVRVAQAAGDLLVFSAHLIHRGTYGLERRSCDILYTDFPEKTETATKLGHFPDANQLALCKHGEIFRTV
jgi:Phytanoyl-CoA dioxygenase (PhyH)